MKKKNYNAPVTMVVPINTESLLVSQSMEVNSTNTVTDDNQVFSRRKSIWEDEDL